MKISIVVEGKTERVFKDPLLDFLRARLPGNMPNLDFLPFDGPIPRDEKLKRIVDNLLTGKHASDYVIALTDVYLGGRRMFVDAADAKRKMAGWVGNEPRFFPHAAQYDFEAWLLPYWDDILKLAGNRKKEPAANPESVDHGKPPARHLSEVFRTGTRGKGYVKTRDAKRILKGKDLIVAINRCPELKDFVNRVIGLQGGAPV